MSSWAACIFWYTAIVRRRIRVAEALAGIDVQLQQRHDLIPNVLTIAKRRLAAPQPALDRSAHPDLVLGSRCGGVVMGSGDLFEPPPYWMPAGGAALIRLENDIRAVLRIADTVIKLDFFAAGRQRHVERAATSM